MPGPHTRGHWHAPCNQWRSITTNTSQWFQVSRLRSSGQTGKPSSTAQTAAGSAMNVTEEMLQAAIKKAIEAGLLPRRACHEDAQINKELMRLVVQAALNAQPADCGNAIHFNRQAHSLSARPAASTESPQTTEPTGPAEANRTAAL